MAVFQVQKRKESQQQKDRYLLEIAEIVSTRATCPRRRVGCVLVDSKQHIVATGYNGVPSGFTHCTEIPCEGAELPSGTGLDVCEAIHAEVNAFLQVRSDDELTAYVTIMPCFSCAKVIGNSKIQRIVSLEWYPAKYVKNVLDQAQISVEIGEI